MIVRAKFKVTRIERQTSTACKKDANGNKVVPNVWEPVEMRTIVMHPVYSNDGNENSKFWDATPSGELKLGTVNPEAWKMFELDGEYYLDFTKA